MVQSLWAQDNFLFMYFSIGITWSDRSGMRGHVGHNCHDAVMANGVPWISQETSRKNTQLAMNNSATVCISHERSQMLS